MSIEDLTSRSQIDALRSRIQELEQQNSDLEIALQTAIEHGDAIDREISMTNRRLVAEVAERVRAEARLERLVDALRQQKADLEILVSTVSEHSDTLDMEWLRRMSHAEARAITDDLTGLTNRRGLNAALDLAWRQCLRSTQPLALIMLDVDYFKDYNDALGHQAGDDCLARLGAMLRRACRRPDDVAARYGGEEFVLVLPRTEQNGAAQVAQSIRGDLAKLAIPHPASPFGVLTVSMGVVAEVPVAGRDIALLLAEADRRLYGAKHDGRDACRMS